MMSDKEKGGVRGKGLALLLLSKKPMRRDPADGEADSDAEASDDGGDYGNDLEMVAEDLIAAIRANKPKAVAAALKAAVNMCSGMSDNEE